MQTLDEWIISMISGLIIVFITYFLKQTINRVDALEKIVSMLKDEFLKKAEHEKDITKLGNEVIQIREDYTPKRDHERAYEEVRNDVKEMKENFLRKDDFLREMAKIDQKMDKIQDLIIKGGK